MNGTLTISPAEPGAPFRIFAVEFADGGSLRARGFPLTDLDPAPIKIGVKEVYATLYNDGDRGQHRLTFLCVTGVAVKIACADLPEIAAPQRSKPMLSHQPGFDPAAV